MGNVTELHTDTAITAQSAIGVLANEAHVVDCTLRAMQAMTALAIDNGEMPSEHVDALHSLLAEMQKKTERLTETLQELQSKTK